jgi:hypothetical protein
LWGGAGIVGQPLAVPVLAVPVLAVPALAVPALAAVMVEGLAVML